MGQDVNGRRKYDASGRVAQARRSRARVLAVARDLFVANGYSATTVAAVAEAAGVSIQSAYKAFGNKTGLVKAVFDVAIAGDDEPAAMIDRPVFARLASEPDPRRKLTLYAAFVAETAPRHVPVQLLVRTAAGADHEAAGLWADLCAERLRGMTRFAEALAPQLRADVTVGEARDLLFAFNSPEHWDLLVAQRGWSAHRYEQHLARSLISALLP